MDLERFRLRAFLESLDTSELEKIDTPVALADVAQRLEGSHKAVWFTHVGPEGAYAANEGYRPPPVEWKPSAAWAVAIGCLFGIALMLMSKVSEFIYFQF